MNFTPIGDTTLHYARDGSPNALPLVFLHSLGSDLRIWDPVVPQFAHGHAIVRYDLRGHGLSDCPPGPYALRDQVADLAGLLAHLQIEAAILIGVSVGGLVALAHALHHPQQVRALVLCDTGARIGTARHWAERSAAVRRHGLGPLAPGILARWFTPAFIAQHPAVYRGFLNMLTRTPPAGYAATCETLRTADLRPALEKIQAPALVLCGAEDRATPPALGRELATGLPQARFDLIEGAAHLPCIEQAPALAQKIDAFLQENGYG